MMLMPLVVRPRYLLLKRLRSPWGSALGSGRILLVRNPKWSSFLYEKSTISKKKSAFNCRVQKSISQESKNFQLYTGMGTSKLKLEM